MNLAVVVRHSGRTKFARVKVPDHAAALRRRCRTDLCAARRGSRRRSRSSRTSSARNIQRAVPGHAGRRRAPVPHHPRHRHGDPGRRGRRPARDRRPRPASSCATARCRCCRSKPTCRAACSTSWSRTSRSTRTSCVRTSRSPGLRRLDRAHRAAPAGAEGSAVRAAHAVGAGRRRDDLRATIARPGLPGPPPVRFVHVGRDVPARRGRRPARRRRSR